MEPWVTVLMKIAPQASDESEDSDLEDSDCEDVDEGESSALETLSSYTPPYHGVRQLSGNDCYVGIVLLLCNACEFIVYWQMYLASKAPSKPAVTDTLTPPKVSTFGEKTCLQTLDGQLVGLLFQCLILWHVVFRESSGARGCKLLSGNIVDVVHAAIDSGRLTPGQSLDPKLSTIVDKLRSRAVVREPPVESAAQQSKAGIPEAVFWPYIIQGFLP